MSTYTISKLVLVFLWTWSNVINIYIYIYSIYIYLSTQSFNTYKISNSDVFVCIYIYMVLQRYHVHVYIYIYMCVCVLYLSKPIRRPAGVSCGSCLFVVVLSVLSLSLSRLSPWHGFLPRLTWAPPTPPPLLPRPPLSSSYSLRCGGLNSAHASRSTPAWFCTSCCHFDGCFHFLVLFAIGLLRRFLYPILDPLAFVPNTFYTYNLSTYGLFQSLSQYGLFQNPGLHTCFGLNLNRGLNKINVFAFASKPLLHKELFYTETVFSCYPQTQCFTQKPCSCWACARAVCSLQKSSFHGGRRNSSKAVK